MRLSFQKIFFAMACGAGLLALLFFGRQVLVPLAVALLASFILFPVCKKLEAWGFSRILATLTSIVGTTLIIAGLIYLFSSQIIRMADEFSDFGDKLRALSGQVIDFVNEHIPGAGNIEKKDVIEKSKEWAEKSGGKIMTGTFSATATFISSAVMVMVYTFLLLIYRTGLKRALVDAAAETNRERLSKMINEMQQVGQQYLLGMAIMVSILGLADSLALLALGIEHPFLFGYLAALLAIIPYVGTTIGGAIPFLYALMTKDSLWIPAGVVLSFWLIQAIETNFLTPKVVGGNLNINALAAIISLIVGGYLWGIAGMAIFLPLTSIFRVFCSYYTPLKPVAALLRDDLFVEARGPGLLKRMKSKLKK